MNNWYRWTVLGLLIVACNEPDPQPQIDGLKQDMVSLADSIDAWGIQVDTLAVRDSELFGRTEQLETANARQDAELVRISDRLEQWPYDSLVWLRNEIVALSRKLAVMSEALDSLRGPVGTPDSLGNICYEVEPDQTFRYFLYHNFRDTLGNYEEGIKYHTAIEAYRTVADLYAGGQFEYSKSSLDYQWHDYNYARFKDVAIVTQDGLVLRIPVNIILPYRNMYYVIAHAVIDKAGNESTWNRSIDEGYYVRVK
ncbi:hypothetical protein [Neomegalonema sp.]|uniref:hypothetical protein n=1 Tax=Neomegalonema sp. TaxID=2039713 RepID=UPI00261D2E17|nr:hypothetical protein [Neomegalonema sp.]MDD2869638.1 hypothetical protein [Neomegalonema sp.]